MTTRLCNYPPSSVVAEALRVIPRVVRVHPHSLTARYWQVDEYGDICDPCHRLWLKSQPCKHPPCGNDGRYNSGYCAVHDITLNDGNGARL